MLDRGKPENWTTTIWDLASDFVNNRISLFQHYKICMLALHHIKPEQQLLISCDLLHGHFGPKALPGHAGKLCNAVVSEVSVVRQVELKEQRLSGEKHKSTVCHRVSAGQGELGKT